MTQVWVLLALLVAGCSNRSQTTTYSGQASVLSAPPRSTADAGVIATNLVREMKIELKAYDLQDVSFERKRHEWWFFYMLKPPGMPGGHFTVVVDDAGKARFIGGL
jgi:hypothetical protein